MEKAAILGVYGFIGYGLCQTLLETGLEIEGIDLAYRENHYKEQKRLEIGRNANFCEEDFQEWEAAESIDILFISLYEKIFSEGQYMDEWMAKLASIKGDGLQVVLILPAALAVKGESAPGIQQKIANFFSRKKAGLLEFYLPTVYGPWQPEEFLFQQSLNYIENGSELPLLTGREWIHDALYIDDAVQLILKTAEKEHEGQFMLSSGEENQWLDCASSLLGPQLDKIIGNPRTSPEIKEGIHIVTVDRNESIKAGILKQKQRFCRIQESSV